LDAGKLVRATLGIYKSALFDAARGFVASAKHLLYHLLLIILIAATIPIANLFGSLAGGFLLGFVLAYIVSCYLVTVRAAIDKNNLAVREMFEDGWALFSPVIGVLFAFFIIGYLGKFLFGGPQAYWILACINLLIAVFFNPIPEILMLRPGFVMSMAQESIEFILENFVEWFLPTILLILPLVLVSPSLSIEVVIQVFTNNPLYALEAFIFVASGFAFTISAAIYLVPILLIIYFVSLFRLALYRSLSTSSRRKRIYQAGLG
jgi:hypothetical protein